MKETAMHENYFLSRVKDKIRLAGQSLAMEPEPIAHPVDEGAHDHLGLCVTITDS